MIDAEGSVLSPQIWHQHLLVRKNLGISGTAAKRCCFHYMLCCISTVSLQIWQIKAHYLNMLFRSVLENTMWYHEFPKNC